ncbi:protein MpPP2C_G [Marchantia polymorpha subsp. ruderalis]|uniref:protein-serine/threonine phosphatase n=2 Tax=Marchantia polymorpha TaxID=3197 RepID=A0AAF6BN49_MARPO|nr:hypothetical protein MARPO_0035s0123 [Marchantia polymorpha]BBN13433.1 hypothetical protein Mp_6g03430 [Marchantia polymorpha subsp. ruderalis]|eukprot:PTQ41354.1 hypothetical protein MARPO_0035s0123 [Marchantia polymorpha]
MAAGTDITHPVSALEAAYKPIPLEPLPVCTIKENGVAVDNNDPSIVEKNRKDRETLQASSRPPRPNPNAAPPTASFVRRSVSTARLTSLSSASDLDTDGIESSERPIFERHPLERMDRAIVEYTPILRSGGWMDQGNRPAMEDTHLRIDNLVTWHAESSQTSEASLSSNEGPGAFYGVFDGHGGKEAADYVRENLLINFLEDSSYPNSLSEAVKNAFYKTDVALNNEFIRHQEWTCGTTALTAIISGRNLLVANAGDCRAVLSKRGVAVQMSRDHKPCCAMERSRIESVGGYVYDGYLNGQLAVARALGDWHMTELKEFRNEIPGRSFFDGPLSGEPELQQAVLTDEDEFMIIGCDGLWDVFTSQNAIDFARKRLQAHNDPERCSKELVKEALVRNTSDNLTVVTVCFQPDPPPKLGKAWVPRFRRSISAEGLRNLQDLLDHDAP